MDLSIEEYRIIVESSPNLIWRAGSDQLRDYCNHTWMKYTGRPLESDLGTGWTALVHPEDLGFYQELYDSAFKNRMPFEVEYRLKRSDGIYRWFLERGCPVYEGQQFTGYVGSCVDVTEKIEGRRYQHRARFDPLTEVMNRQQVLDEIGQLLSMHQREDTALSLVMLDLDNFKWINDTYGHLVGDEVLRCAADAIRRTIRSQDFVGRYGGDEFLLVLPDTELSQAAQVARRIQEALSGMECSASGEPIALGCSMGLADYETGRTVDQLLDLADKAMYRAKKRGGRSFEVF